MGGGRYDGLVELMGGPALPGVGWAAGIERLAMLIEEPPTPPRPVAVIPIGEAGERVAAKIAEGLRSAGYVVDLGYSGNLARRMRRADRVNARAAVLIGEDEIAHGMATLRDLDSGAQHGVAIAELPAKLAAFDGLRRAVWKPASSSRLQQLLRRHAELRAALSGSGLGGAEFAKLSKEFSELTPIVEEVGALDRARQEIASLSEMARSADDPDLKALAEEELRGLRQRLPDLENKVKLSLLPKDADDERNAILEVRAGTGGEEAALFAAELFRMYQRYAALHGWRFEILDLSETGLGGFKEATASIAGRNVFARVKFESGVHRVQRVPETEAGGRIHTSAATVAVLPEAEEVDVKIDDKDLRIDVFRASGPGGQSVNTTDSAVRVTHLPTGLVVIQQDEKSQHKNKARAMKVLRSRLYEMERQARDSARAAERKSQVGSGDRSERIRTYNFPQGRVTDHRINLTLYKIDKVMTGEALDEIIDAILAEDQATRLASVEG